MRRGTDINKILSPLSEKPFQAYLSNQLQVADLLEWILGQVGISRIWQTSFSISEEFLRRLYFLMQNGQMEHITLILDHKATNMTLRLWPFICQVFRETYLADNHSKILLVKSAKGDLISVVTSQNLTRGNRCESAVVTSDKEIFAKLFDSVQNIIKFHSVPLHELFAERVGAN
jgi:hypothetical protein